jgi:predicted ATPase/DNA-binding CsgD family transcriptional regulator
MSSRLPNSAEAPVEPLTRREREILALLAQGLSGPEIAEKLTLAPSSVKWHIHQLYGKLGVGTKQRALLRASELGLLELAGVGAGRQPANTSPARHNLPLQVTRFFGREADVAQLKTRVSEHRLVTLTGSGGVGKTRLSLQAAEEMLDEFPDGVWYVELAPLTDPDLVTAQVAAVLGLRDEPGRPALQRLTAHLRERKALLVLDNCEHLLTACAQLADHLLRACLWLRLLASSREPLGVPGEAVVVVPSLPFPDPSQPIDPERLDDYAAVQLFVDRVRLVLPDYQADAQNAAALASICQRLDGIPLALELAAARLRVLDAQTLAGRLDDVFRVLTGGSRTALPRQQTLRAAIDWSYNLLTEPERLLLQRLSVFAGGCTLEAAEVVCVDSSRGEGIAPGDVLDLLASLVAKSMVDARRPAAAELRYRLLETVRQYAREKLNDSRQSSHLHTLHLNFYRSLAVSAVPKKLTPERRAWESRLRAEQENIRLALQWAFSDEGNHANVDAGIELFRLIHEYVILTDQEMLAWGARALALCQAHKGISSELYARLLGLHSFRLFGWDVQAALAGLNRAVELSRALGLAGRPILARNLIMLADRLASLDDYEPIWSLFAEAEVIVLETGQPGFEAHEIYQLKVTLASQRARLSNKQGRYEKAKVYAREAIQLATQNGTPWANWFLIDVGEANIGLGELELARDNFLTALATAKPYGGLAGLSYANRWLGITELRLGNVDRAREYCRASLRHAMAAHDPNFTASGLALAAGVWARLGSTTRAAKLSGAAQALYALSGWPPWEDSSLDTLLPGWRDQPDAPAISAAFEAGLAMNAEQATAYALDDNAA